MAMAVFGLAVYLMGLARWGKSLKAKNATSKARRIYGLLGATPMLLVPVVFGGGPTDGGAILFVWAWFVACATLGYTTVAHAPLWIVGKPK